MRYTEIAPVCKWSSCSFQHGNEKPCSPCMLHVITHAYRQWYVCKLAINANLSSAIPSMANTWAASCSGNDNASMDGVCFSDSPFLGACAIILAEAQVHEGHVFTVLVGNLDIHNFLVQLEHLPCNRDLQGIVSSIGCIVFWLQLCIKLRVKKVSFHNQVFRADVTKKPAVLTEAPSLALL